MFRFRVHIALSTSETTLERRWSKCLPHGGVRPPRNDATAGLQAPDQAQWGSSFEAPAHPSCHKSSPFHISHTCFEEENLTNAQG